MTWIPSIDVQIPQFCAITMSRGVSQSWHCTKKNEKSAKTVKKTAAFIRVPMKNLWFSHGFPMKTHHFEVETGSPWRRQVDVEPAREQVGNVHVDFTRQSWFLMVYNNVYIYIIYIYIYILYIYIYIHQYIYIYTPWHHINIYICIYVYIYILVHNGLT